MNSCKSRYLWSIDLDIHLHEISLKIIVMNIFNGNKVTFLIILTYRESLNFRVMLLLQHLIREINMPRKFHVIRYIFCTSLILCAF